ncbi:hypothetical protein [Undibacterium sp. TS12]|uniref:hypothetical protein n=1 Tax=Undibacterium sp. TS12 TaxID=2908202 RepID=UPI001F4C65F2|nr:hypothetical protein [Undibacterium sp. TS12]MCH8622542.1 hypothetical protein [Undibacterium sp. TS12]
MKSKFVLLGGVLILVAVSTTVGYVWYPRHQGEQLVREALKDPDSAVFRDVKYFRKTKGVCGLVNAKNSLGGYVGFNDFMLNADGKVTFAPTGDSSVGSADERLDVLQKRIAYLEEKIKTCPDETDKK